MPEPDAAPDLAAERALLEPAVRAAAEEVRALGSRGVKRWTKPDGTPVTEADLTADRMLRDALEGARPDYGWLSEESGHARPGARRTWIIDPIDGTSAFMTGKADWCVAAALIEDGRPVLAAVHAPVTDETFVALRGGGAWRNGSRLTVSGRAELAGSGVVAGPQVLQPVRWQHALPLVARHGVASLVLRLCRVAEGRYDAMVTFGFKNDWDIAPGDLIVAEAGGRVSDIDGSLLSYGAGEQRRRGVIAAGPQLHETIIAHGPKGAAG